MFAFFHFYRAIVIAGLFCIVLAGPRAWGAEGDLVISELMAINDTALPTTVEGKRIYPDWIEVHNRSAAPVSLTGWYLTDDPNDLEKWGLPALTLGPGGYLVVFASGVPEQDHPENWPYRDEAGYYHTNFRLEGNGEYLALVSPRLAVVHEYGTRAGEPDEGGFPPQQADISYGLHGDQEQYFTEPSPGSANGSGYAEISAEPVFSQPGGTFTGFFLMELSSPNPEAEIHLTLDGRAPTTSSLKYEVPLPMVGTREIMARAYEPGKAPSAAVSRTYVAVASDLLRFSSDLPIVVVDTEKRGVGSGSFTRVQSVFIDRSDDGRAYILGEADFAGRGGLRIRGSSTAGVIKHQYAFETWDDNDRDKAVSLLGFPADGDWVLYAPLVFDRALINNALAYELSNQVGRYAVRTRFCEVYLNKNDATVSASDYVGLYIFMERITQGPQRVDVEELHAWDSTEPTLSGGYMLSIDRTSSGSTFHTSHGTPHGGTFNLLYPQDKDVTVAQRNWIRAFLDEFEDALYGPNFADPLHGYAGYIDVDSFIDHNLINMLPMNVDAFRLSGYMFKKRGRKLELGPVWDYDRAMESTDGRDNNAQSWNGTGDGTDYFDHRDWWYRLFEDANFWQKYIDRWYDLRTGPFSTENIHATIDAMAEEVREAQARNYQRWSSHGPRFGGFQGEIDHMKDWFATRTTWIDNQFAAPPRLFPEGGVVETSSPVAVFNPHGAGGVVYYTLEGSDPRLPQTAGTLLDSTTLVPESAAKRVLVPAGPVVDAWRSDLSFDDSAWTPVTGEPGGVGYEHGSGYQNYLSIDLENRMYNSLTSCCIRIPFVLADDPSEFNYAALNVRYDDGFVAYLNGVEVARALFSGTPAWNSSANGNHDDSAAVRLEEFDISLQANLLRRGQNLLAIQGLNSSTTSSDFLISAELIAGHSTSPGDSGVSETAQQYVGPIVLTASAEVTARVLVPGNRYSPWSGPARAVFAVGPVAESLRVSELMYHPADGDDPNDPNTEYVELTNVGSEAINLNLVKFTDGIDFTFNGFELASGGYCLVVKDVAAFEGKYGPGFNIAGQYDGKLSNAGERLALQDAVGQPILDFSFDDNWYDETDGDGYSLIVTDPVGTDPNDWGLKSSWRAGPDIGGSPGAGQ